MRKRKSNIPEYETKVVRPGGLRRGTAGDRENDKWSNSTPEPVEEKKQTDEQENDCGC